jgi:hypothetical protein
MWNSPAEASRTNARKNNAEIKSVHLPALGLNWLPLWQLESLEPRCPFFKNIKSPLAKSYVNRVKQIPLSCAGPAPPEKKVAFRVEDLDLLPETVDYPQVPVGPDCRSRGKGEFFVFWTVRAEAS